MKNSMLCAISGFYLGGHPGEAFGGDSNFGNGMSAASSETIAPSAFWSRKTSGPL